MSKNSSTENPVKVFGFRLPPKEREKFIARAAALAMSPHELARLYVMERLSANEADEDVRDSLARIQSDLTDTRQELALAAMAILQHGGKTTKQVAEEFVAKNMVGARSEP